MQDSSDNIIVISIFAKNGQQFASYDLLQAISATGMKFGERNIFHYYLPASNQKKHLFSLASATEPGYFDWDKIGEFTCKGICLFMDINNTPNPLDTFALMIATAEQLADDLDGELRAGPHAPWDDEKAMEYENKILSKV